MSYLALKPLGRLALAFALLSCAAQPSRAMVIDDFETAPFSITRAAEFVGPWANQTGLDPAHVLLGQRSASIDVGSGAGVGVSLSLTNGDDSGVMTVPAGKRGNWTGSYLSLAGSAPDTLDDVDLTTEGHGAIGISVSEVPSTGLELGIFLATEPTGRRASLRRTVWTTGEHLLRFSDLVPFPGEALPDLTDVDTLYVYASTTAGATPVTVGISNIRTVAVPEPTAAGAAGALLLAGLWRRRRGRR